ncbi:MAG: hypothetical protein KC643_27955, partial [Nitrospira sp.]|nr:hypothetical protein [Nitrospira sp.]
MWHASEQSIHPLPQASPFSPQSPDPRSTEEPPCRPMQMGEDTGTQQSSKSHTRPPTLFVIFGA